MYLCIAQIAAMLTIIRQALFRVSGIARCGPAHTLRAIAVRMLTWFHKFIVRCSGRTNMRTEIQTYNLMLKMSSRSFCAPGPHHKCHAPARQRNALGPNIQALGALS
jgi:hypothetical protein